MNRRRLSREMPNRPGAMRGGCIRRLPTGRRQTNWLYTKHVRGFELGRMEKQIKLVVDRVEGLNPEPLDYNTSALNHSATLLPCGLNLFLI